MKSKTIAHIIYSLVITCVAEMILLATLGKKILAAAESQSRNVVSIVVLLFVLFGIILFVVLFWLFQKKSYDYIGRIADGVRNMAAGDLNTRIDVSEDDEFAEIAMSLNSMAGELQKLMDREREVERSKNELITNVAHDLRTPLTSIIGYMELLKARPDLPEDTRVQYLSIAYTKSKRLEKLIEDLFGFTKLNYGKIAMKVDKVDVVKLLSQLMDEFYPNFSEKGLQYDLTSNVPVANIRADANLLARLFDNLINNAIKYGSDGKRIDVKILAEGDTVSVAVINYGKVIPQEELPHLFDKFYRVDASRNNKTGGTGLGLAIAKNIVDMHDGRIRVESDLRGTRFIVDLKVNFDINKEHFDNA